MRMDVGPAMIKISGLDELQRELEQAQHAMEAIDGELTQVSFDPEDPASIEAAIQQVNDAIDQRVGEYSQNAIVSPLIDQMKERYRQAILEKAAETRLGDAEDDGE